MATPRELAHVLLDRCGLTIAEELGIKVERNTPSPLFRLLCAALLLSTRISAAIAVQAARALAARGWTTPRKMAEAISAERTSTLNRSGYARYDESTSRMLGETSRLLLERHGGDLRRLREAASRNPGRERMLLKQFKGIGEVGADIFFREVQVAWDELYPFADRKALRGAQTLGLPTDPHRLAALVDRADYPRLLAALIRVQLEHKQEQVSAWVQT